MELNLKQASSAELADINLPVIPRNGMPWTQRAWSILAAPLLLLFTFPIVAIFLKITPQQITETLVQPQVYQAVTLSLRTTLVSLALTILLGTPLSYLIGTRRFPLRNLVETIIDLPTVLPPSVAGVALLMTFGRRGMLGPLLQVFGIEITFTMAAVIVAQVFVASSFFIRAAALGFAGINPELQQAAQLDGANRWQTFRYIVLPLSRYALLSGAVMSWSRALGEFGATILFAGNFPGRTQTMPLAIYLGFESNIEIALVLSVILVLISFFSLLVLRGILNGKTD